jgi:hypothetical protein
MRQRVGTAKEPGELVSYYQNWLGELADCGHLYKPDPKRSKGLHEAVATQMATVLGEETSSYLTMQRLYADQARSDQVDWLDRWRATAIIGVAGVADLLEPPK